MKHIRIGSIASGTAAAMILIGGVASAQSATFTSEFGIGARGGDVTTLQTWLENNGYYSGPVTGYFGTLTRAAVERYQRAQGISATGFVGPLTLAALNGSASVSGSGSTSVSGNASEVAALQAQLNALLAEIKALEGNTVTTGAPVASSVTLQTNQGLGVSGALGTSAGTSPFTYTITSNPLNGMISSFNPSTGTFTYTPHSNYSGTDTFSYTVSNSSGTSAPVTVSINVGANSTNSAPSGQAFSFSTSNGAAYNGSLSASGSTPYTFAVTSQPSHGTISSFNPSTGTFTYTPTANYSGSDTFTYTVTNSAGVSSPVTVTVNNGTTSTSVPTAQNYSFSTSNGASVNGTLVASGTGPFTYKVVTQPTHGVLSSFNTTNGAFMYTPTNGYTGSDSFTYTVSNSLGTSSTYTVNLTD